MGRTRAPYPPEFREQMVELVRTGRTPESLSREFEPTAIVEHLDIIEQIGLRVVASPVDLLSYTLLLQAAEERLGDGVVPAVSSPAHARLKVVGSTEVLEVEAAVLRTLVAMN